VNRTLVDRGGEAAGRVITALRTSSLAIYAGITLFYGLFRVGSFTNMPDRVTDTPTYERVAHLALWDWRFYVGERGFTIPLFFKIFQSTEARSVAQLVFSTFAWLVLAAVVASCIEIGWLRPVAFAVVLTFSLTTEVILWDALLLSESVTFALCALLIAVWILLIRSPRPLWATAVLVLSLLWAFARDTNAYVLVSVALLVAFTLVRGGHRRLKLVLALGCCAIFLLAYGSAQEGKRGLQPMVDVVDHRVLTTPSLQRYFVARGFDPNVNWPIGSWIRNRSQGVYASYLLKHPGYTLAAPFHGHQHTLFSTSDNAASLIDPNLSIYNDNASHRFLPLPRMLEHIFFPRGIALICVLLALVLVAAAAVAGIAGASYTWLVPLGILATTYPQFLVAWHESGLEVDRHALEASLLLRLSTLLLGCLVVDRLLAALLRARSTSPSASTTILGERP
jgi:hypothetical protein